MTNFVLSIVGYGDIAGNLELETPPPPTNLTNYKQVKHDFEVAGVEGEKQRIHLPETVKTFDDHFVPLDAAWQWYWFRLLVHSWSGYRFWDERLLTRTELTALKSAWGSLTKSWRALTNNGHGSDVCHDYINNANVNADDMAIETLTMGGNVVRLTSSPTVKAGVEVVQIAMLDGMRQPPDIALVNRLTRPDLIHVCTNVASLPTDIDPFPQLGGKDVLFPFVSKRINYIRTVRLKDITTLPPPPYYP